MSDIDPIAVHPALRKGQLRQLEILKEFHHICIKHGIDYWIDSGTLLGAVRHQGFIPWDDDVDVSISSEQCGRLQEIMQRELPEHLFFQSRQTDVSYCHDTMKIRLNGTLQIEDYNEMLRPYHKGIFIDILPFVGYPAISRERTKWLVKKIRRAYNRKQAHLEHPLMNLIKRVIGGLEMALYQGIWQGLTPASPRYMCYRPYENYGNNRISVDDIFPLGEIEFEGVTVKAPRNPDGYLRSIYGNSYMQLPPPEKRQSHSLIMIPEVCYKRDDVFFGVHPDKDGLTRWGLRDKACRVKNS